MRSLIPLFLFFCEFWLIGPALAQTNPPTNKVSLVKVSGGLNAYAGVYTASGIATRSQPSPFGLSGSVTDQGAYWLIANQRGYMLDRIQYIPGQAKPIHKLSNPYCYRVRAVNSLAPAIIRTANVRQRRHFP